jgi:hypothetical protein
MTKIMLGFWTFPPEDRSRRDPLQSTRADRVVFSLAEALGALGEGSGDATSPGGALPKISPVAASG